MAIFKKPVIKAEGGKKKEIPRGLFQKCPGCSEVVPEIELAQNQRVCPRCDYHFVQPAKERIQNLLDPDSFVEMDAGLKSVDVLRDRKSTRLNSSHGSISYAVFCLKKKHYPQLLDELYH